MIAFHQIEINSFELQTKWATVKLSKRILIWFVAKLWKSNYYCKNKLHVPRRSSCINQIKNILKRSMDSIIYSLLALISQLSANDKRSHNPLNRTLVKVSVLLVSSIIVRTIWSTKLIRKNIWGSAQKQPSSKNQFLSPSW